MAQTEINPINGLIIGSSNKALSSTDVNPITQTAVETHPDVWTGSSADNQRYDVDDFDSFAKHDVRMYPQQDWEDERAKNQSKLDAWGNGLGRFVGKTLTDIGETIGFGAGAVAGLATWDFDKVINNGLVKTMESAGDWVESKTPIHETNAQKNSDLFSWDHLSSAKFLLGDLIGEGGSFLLSAYLIGGAAGKAIEGAGVLGKLGQEYGEARMTAEALEGLSPAQISNEVNKAISGNIHGLSWMDRTVAAQLNNLPKHIASAVATYSEGSFEARQTYKDMIDKGSSQEEAIDAAKKDLALNMLGLPLMEYQYSGLFKGPGAAQNFMKEVIAGTAEEAGKADKLSNTFKKIGYLTKDAIKTSAAEGLQEGIQQAMQDVSKKNALHTNFLQDTADVAKQFLTHFSDRDYAEQILQGALIGIIPGAHEGHVERKEERNKVNFLQNALKDSTGELAANNIYKEQGDLTPKGSQLLKQASTFYRLEHAKNIALAKNDMESYDQIHFMQLSNMAYYKFQAGLADRFQDELTTQGQKDWAGQGITDFGKDESGNLITPQKRAEMNKSTVRQLQKIYDTIESVFPAKGNSPAEQEIYRKRLWDEASIQHYLKNKITQLDGEYNLATIHSANPLVSDINSQVAALKQLRLHREELDSKDSFYNSDLASLNAAEGKLLENIKEKKKSKAEEFGIPDDRAIDFKWNHGFEDPIEDAKAKKALTSLARHKAALRQSLHEVHKLIDPESAQKIIDNTAKETKKVVTEVKEKRQKKAEIENIPDGTPIQSGEDVGVKQGDQIVTPSETKDIEDDAIVHEPETANGDETPPPGGDIPIFDTSRKGMKKDSIYTTAGKEIEYTGHTFLDDVYDEHGNLLRNSDPEQIRWFDYIRNKEDLAAGHYLKVEIDPKDPEHLKGILYRGTERIQVDGKDVWDSLHLPDYIENLAVLEPGYWADKGEFTEQEIQLNALTYRENYIKFRESIKKSLSEGEEVYLNITDKSGGIPVTIEDDITTGFPKSESVIGRIADNIEQMRDRVFVAESRPARDEEEYFIRTNPETIVNRPGEVWSLVKDLSGDMRPTKLITRHLTGNEVDMVVDSIKLLFNYKKPNVKEVTYTTNLLGVQRTNRLNITKDILSKIIFWGKSRSENSIYVEGNTIFFGGSRMSIKDLHTGVDKEALLREFLRDKIHQVDKNLLSSKEPFILPTSIKEGVAEVKAHDDYLHYLFGDDQVLGTNLAKKEDIQFVQPYLTFENSISRPEVLKEQEEKAPVPTTYESKGAAIENPEDLTEGLFRTKLSIDYKKADISHSLSELQRILPQVPVEVWNGLIDVASQGRQAFGLFRKGMIVLSDEAEVGTEYHEAFHAVTHLLLKDSERESLYKEARKKWGDGTDLEMEEKLAEAFRDYALSEGKVTFGKTGIFQKIWNMIKSFFGVKSITVNAVFDKINKGQYAQAKPITRNLTYLDDIELARTVNGLSVTETKDLLDAITAQFLNRLLRAGYTAETIDISTGTANKIYNEIMGLYTDKMKGYIGDVVRSNWKEVENLHRESMKKFFMEIEKRDELDEIFPDAEDMDLSEIEDRPSKNDADTREANKFSTKHGMAPNIKLLVASLMNIENGKILDANGLGLPITANFEKTYNWLMNNLSGSITSDDMWDRMEAMRGRKPFMDNLLSKLNSPTDESEKVRLRTQFFQQFAKTKSNYLTYLIDAETGSIFPVDSNANRVEDKVIQRWETNFRNSDMVEYVNGDMGINKKQLAEVLKIEDPLKFLEAIGIIFTGNIDTESTKFKNAYRWIKDDFLRKTVLRGATSISSLFDKADDSTGANVRKRMKELVGMQLPFEEEITELQFINGEGETVYMMSLNNTLSILLSDPAGIKANIYNKNSTWKDKVKDASITILDSTRKNEPGKKGIPTSELKKPDLISTKMNALLNPENPVYGFFRTADKKLEFGISGLPVITEGITYNKGTFEFSDAVITQMYGYYEDELSRIKYATDKGDNIEVFKRNKGKFMLFDDILSNPLKEAVIAGEGREGEVIAAIEAYLNDRCHNAMEYSLKNGIVYMKGNVVTNNAISEDIFKNSKYRGKSLNDVIAIFAVNDLFGKIEMSKLITGDIALYKDFFKRTPGAIATGKIPDTGASINSFLQKTIYDRSSNEHLQNKIVDGTFKVATFKDVEVKSVYYDQYLDALTKSFTSKGVPEGEARDRAHIILDPYTKMNEADAQGYITLEEYREFMTRLGEWNNRHDKLYRKIIGGEELELDDYHQFQPLKPMYYGPKIRQDELGITGYLKLSLMPLIPTVIKGTQLENMMNGLYESGAGIGVFVSGSKVGAENVQELYKDGEIVPHGMLTSTYDYRYMKLQLDIAQKIEKSILDGTQQRKMLWTNQFGLGKEETTFDVDGEDIKSTKLFDEYSNIQKELVDRSRISLLKELGLQDEGEYINVAKDNKTSEPMLHRMISLLKKEIGRRELPSNLIDAIEIGEDGESFKTPLDILSNRNKIENVLNAIVNNRVIKQKMSGRTLVQGAVTGFERGRRTNTSSIEAVNKSIAEEELTESQKESLSDPLVRELIKIGKPIESTGALAGPRIENGAVKPMQVYLPAHFNTTGLDIKDIEPKLLRMIGYRIPTQGPNSIDMLEVVGFLPPEAGSLVIVASEITAKAGSDFDIDKLNIFMRNVSYEDGKPTLPAKREKQGISSQDTRFLQNRLLDIYEAVLSHPDSFIQTITPNSAEILKNDANYTRYLEDVGWNRRYTKEDFDRWMEKRGELSGSPTRNFEFETNIETSIRFLSGKAGVGQTAIHNTHHVMSQVKKLFIDGDVILRYKYNEENDKVSLAGIYDQGGNLISDTLSAFLNAYVDIAKDPFVFDLNANTLTANTIFFMLRTGADYRWVNRFMSQPIIKEYIAAMNANEGIVIEKNRDLRKSKDKLLLDIQEKYAVGEKTDNIYTLDEMDRFMGDIAKGRIGSENSSAQLQFLDDFLRYQDYSKKLQAAMAGSSWDTKGTGKNLNESHLLISDDMEAESSGFIGNYSKLKDSFLGAFREGGARMAVKAFGQFFITESPSIQLVRSTLLSKSVAYKRSDKLQLLDRINNDSLSYIFNTKGSLDLSGEEIKRLMIDSTEGKSVIRKIADIQSDKKDPLHGNILFRDILEVQINRKQGRPNTLFFRNKKVDTSESELITEAFRELHSMRPDLVKDIVKIGMLQSGLNNSPFSFSQFVPNEMRTELLTESINEFLRDPNIDPTDFINKFVGNNYLYGRMAATMKVSRNSQGIITYQPFNRYTNHLELKTDGRANQYWGVPYLTLYTKGRGWQLYEQVNPGELIELDKWGDRNKLQEYNHDSISAIEGNEANIPPEEAKRQLGLDEYGQIDSVSLLQQRMNKVSDDEAKERKEDCE